MDIDFVLTSSLSVFLIILTISKKIIIKINTTYNKCIYIYFLFLFIPNKIRNLFGDIFPTYHLKIKIVIAVFELTPHQFKDFFSYKFTVVSYLKTL